MIAPHELPKPVKHMVLVGAVVLVIMAYTGLCAGAGLLVTTLLLEVHP